MTRQDKASADDNLLTSWKEIAAYLGRDVRTCLRWEKKFGLPVHRLDPVSEKARVFAYRNELAAWLQQSKTSGARPSALHGLPVLRFFFRGLFLGIVGSVAVALFFLMQGEMAPKEPVDFKIKGSVLAILNESGKVLWHYDTGLENLAREELYRRHFQFKRVEQKSPLPYLLIRDLDRDGRREVLFSLQTQDEAGEGKVLCFDSKGRLLWQFAGGREMKFGENTFSGDFRTQGILAEELDEDGRLEVIVVSIHRPSWPCQFVLLDHQGHIRGEYWNAGYFGDLACADLNHDGVKEIIAGGMNNEYGLGCLVVFDVASIKGGSPQESPEFRCPELEAGSELYYLLFPRTDVDLADGYPAEAIDNVEVLSNRTIQVQTSLSRLYFDLSLSLDSPEVIISHGFMQAHERAVLAGKVKSVLNSDYKRNLLKGIRYWDGSAWLPAPAMNREWQQLRVHTPDFSVGPLAQKRGEKD
jgi:hypothetical protein